jgi:hypothetical protein
LGTGLGVSHAVTALGVMSKRVARTNDAAKDILEARR